MAEPGATPSNVAARLAERSKQTPKRRLVADRLATWFVSAGGIAIILSILGILLFIVVEVWPLTTAARVTPARRVALPGPEAEAIIADEHRSHVAAVGPDAKLRVMSLETGALVAEVALFTEAEAAVELTRIVAPAGGRLLAGATRDGRVAVVPIRFQVRFEGQDRKVDASVGQPVVLTVDPAGQPVGNLAAQLDEDGKATVAAEVAGGGLAVVRRSVEENLMTGEVAESVERFAVAAPPDLSALVVTATQRDLYAGTESGELIHWSLASGEPVEGSRASAGRSAVTALNLLLGDRSLVVGQANGALSVWMLNEGAAAQADTSGTVVLTRVRDFPAHPSAVSAIAPSQRGKGFLALSQGGTLGMYYSTSGRTLWTGRAPVAGASTLLYAPKADGAFLAGPGEIAELDIHNPHPEVTWKSLFGKVWYEGYDKPELVWQSTGATDDFESKLSLTPLLVGTLKGTVYSLLLAIPLGVFGAMYTSQFMHPVYKRYVKPAIEIMASLPSVVLGFLAGLWLAPRLEEGIPALVIMVVALPLLVLLAGYLWNLLPRRVRGRFPVGTEALLFVLVLGLGIWMCFALSAPFERLAFGGNFQAWLLETTGLPFDQRNAVVVGLAMGFAVIPIIFAIAEDAFSNVPANLVAGSLALGADRWQTVTRVVLPTASPGIFSAVMIGFGRAVGETMIVLMATGNTPIMDWNPFNGFRTLSANIAVEIPEAPVASTLYRTLFLAALLLFILTFLVNTVAELVRQRLRTRYSQL